MLGALMTLGIGLYAPCMILVSFLGMSETTAFPIMMGSCAFLMPVGSLRFIRERSYSLRAALGLAIGGIPGVLLAAYIVKSLPLVTVRWLVIVVVIYTAITMLYSAFSEERTSRARRSRQAPDAAHAGADRAANGQLHCPAGLLVAAIAVLLRPLRSWTPQTSGVNARLRGVSAVSDRVAWASGANGTILRTTDGGETWQRLSIPETNETRLPRHRRGER